MSANRPRLVLGAALTIAVLSGLSVLTNSGTPTAATPSPVGGQRSLGGAHAAPTPAPMDAHSPVSRPTHRGRHPSGRRVLPRPQHGEQAIQALGTHLPAVAARAGWSPAKLRTVLRTDDTAYVSTQGRVYYREADVAQATTSPTSAATTYAPAFPTSQTFGLHSRPGATRKIFLDFDGATVSGTAWNGTGSGKVPDGTHVGFDLDGNPSTFNTAEHGFIQEVWREVSETYSPFDVDVTTADPGVSGIARGSSSDTSFGTHVLITSSNVPRAALCGSCLGVAYVGNFDDVDPSAHYQPAWVFAYSKNFSPMVIAQAASHENGHTVGLAHDGTVASGTTPAAPYFGGTSAWGPIMGSSMDRAVSQFSKGEYALADNAEDDFAVMQGTGLPLRPDDHVATEQLGALSSYAANGVIGTRTDTDSFAISLPCTTTLSVKAAGIGTQTALDLKLTVLDGNGATVASNSPVSLFSGSPPVSSGMNASVTVPNATGPYVLRVDGVGNGNAAAGGWSDYGSLGQYTLTATGCASTTPSATPTSSSSTPIASPLPTPSVAPAPVIGSSPSPSPTPTATPTAQRRHHAPGAPRIGWVTPGPRHGIRTATVRWYAPATTSDAPVGSYRVLAMRIDSRGRVRATYTMRPVHGTVRAVSVRLPKGTYRFRVQALNDAGASSWSATSRAVRAR